MSGYSPDPLRTALRRVLILAICTFLLYPLFMMGHHRLSPVILAGNLLVLGLSASLIESVWRATRQLDPRLLRRAEAPLGASLVLAGCGVYAVLESLNVLRVTSYDIESPVSVLLFTVHALALMGWMLWAARQLEQMGQFKLRARAKASAVCVAASQAVLLAALSGMFSTPHSLFGGVAFVIVVVVLLGSGVVRALEVYRKWPDLDTPPESALEPRL